MRERRIYVGTGTGRELFGRLPRQRRWLHAHSPDVAHFVYNRLDVESRPVEFHTNRDHAGALLRRTPVFKAQGQSRSELRADDVAVHLGTW